MYFSVNVQANARELTSDHAATFEVKKEKNPKNMFSPTVKIKKSLNKLFDRER